MHYSAHTWDGGGGLGLLQMLLGSPFETNDGQDATEYQGVRFAEKRGVCLPHAPNEETTIKHLKPAPTPHGTIGNARSDRRTTTLGTEVFERGFSLFFLFLGALAPVPCDPSTAVSWPPTALG